MPKPTPTAGHWREAAAAWQHLSRSVRTVDHPLPAVFAKLGVDSRVAAIQAAQRADLASPSRQFGQSPASKLANLKKRRRDVSAILFIDGALTSSLEKENTMPRYRIERNFSDGLSIPMNDDGRKAVAGVVANNAEHGVTWVHSCVTPDRKNTFCIYDAPAPEAIRKVADRNRLSVGRITEVSVLDPFFYQPG